MKKFRNYGFWTALSGALVLFLKTLGDACGFSIQQETISNLVMALAELLVVFGIVTMPKNSEDEAKNSDDKKEETEEEEFEEALKEQSDKGESDKEEK